MSARLDELSQMPDWPRGLSVDQAAAYVGVSAPTFLQEVAQGKWPQPATRGAKGSRRIWDRRSIDEAYDRASGLTKTTFTEEDAISKLQ